jgi:transposase
VIVRTDRGQADTLGVSSAHVCCGANSSRGLASDSGLVRAELITLQRHLLRLDARCAIYIRQVERLEAELTTLKLLQAEVTELRERLGLNSRNPSQPPSSDPPQQRRRRKHEPSGRKVGGQPGHLVHYRQLRPEEEVDQIIDLRPECCQQCGGLLLGDDPVPARHQVSEIPCSAPEVIEYRRHRLACLACGFINHAQWPEEMLKGSFGPRVQATVAFLTGRIGASQRDVVEIMQTVYGLKVSLGSVPAIQQEVSLALEQPVQAAQDYVQHQPVNYVDETTWPENREQHWLWVNAAEKATIFKLLPGRSQEEARQVIGSEYAGIAATDRFGAYNWLGDHRRQICWAHLKRDFQCLVERGGESEKVGQQLLEQIKEMFGLWHQLQDGQLSRPEFVRTMKPVQGRVGALLREGSESDHAKTQRTCRNLIGVETALWSFVEVPGVEPTNNAAERHLRRAVLWRRKSLGAKSISGSRFVERVLTTVTTLRQQGRDVLDHLNHFCASSKQNDVSLGCLLPDLLRPG